MRIDSTPSRADPVAAAARERYGEELGRAVAPPPRSDGPRRVVLYARVSTPEQAEDDKTSLTTQREEGEAHIERHGDVLVAYIEDVGSGLTSQRKGFQRLLRMAAAGEMDVVLAWKVDRLGRGMYPINRLMEACDQGGVTIEAVREPVNYDLLGLYAWVAQQELQNIRERTMTARRRDAASGIVPTRMTAYGITCDADGYPVLDETEAAVLLEAGQRYASGEAVGAICADFRARGITTRQPGRLRREPWSEAYLYRLLKDEGYATGQRLYGRPGRQPKADARPRRRRMDAPPAPAPVVVEYPVVYPPELWAAICARRKQNTTRPIGNTQHFYLLQHLVWCRCCELRFSAWARTRYTALRGPEKVRKEYVYDTPRRFYADTGMVTHKLKCRTRKHLPAEWLEATIWGLVVTALEHPAELLASIERKRDDLDAQHAEALAETGGGMAGRQLEALHAERKGYLRQEARGQITEAELAGFLVEVDEKAAYWTTRLDAERGLRGDLDAQRAELARAEAYVRELRDGLPADPNEATPAQRRTIVLALIDRIWVEPDGSLCVDGLLDPEGRRVAAEAGGGLISSRSSSTPSPDPTVPRPPAAAVPFTLTAPAAAGR